MQGSWKTHKCKKVYENPYFSVVEHDVTKPDSSKGKFYVMHRKTGVVIVPYDGQRLYLVNQYRFSVQRRLWEFPAGASETEDHLQQAKKELLEETGITAKSWQMLGQFACAPGHTDHYGRVYLAQNLEFGEHQRDGGESDMEMKDYSVEDVEKMIATGEIIDSWTIVPFYFFIKYRDRLY